MSVNFDSDDVFMPVSRDIPIGEGFEKATPLRPILSPTFEFAFMGDFFSCLVTEALKPQVRDFEGRLVEVTACALHGARPDPEQLCMNDLIAGMPKPAVDEHPFDWLWDLISTGITSVPFLSIWSGERCVALHESGDIGVSFGVFHAVFGYGGTPSEAIPMPSRYTRPERAT